MRRKKRKTQEKIDNNVKSIHSGIPYAHTVPAKDIL